MPKRKAVSVSDDEQLEDDVQSDTEVGRPLKQAKSKKVKNREPEVHDEEPPKKTKSKAQKAGESKESKQKGVASIADEAQEDGSSIRVNGQGERYIDLGKKRRATVRNFKGTIFLDLREYYGQEGDEQPGKKGLMLHHEQWEALKNSSEAIDALFAKARK